MKSRLIGRGGYSHGWLGNTTDERRDFETGFDWQFLSVGLPSHPWESKKRLTGANRDNRDCHGNRCCLCLLLLNFLGSGRRPGWENPCFIRVESVAKICFRLSVSFAESEFYSWPKIAFESFELLTVFFFASREDFFGAEAQLPWPLGNVSRIASAPKSMK